MGPYANNNFKSNDLIMTFKVIMGIFPRAIVPIELTEKWIHMLKGNVLIPQK